MEIGDLDNVKKPVKAEYTDPLQYLNDLELYALYKSQESDLLQKAYINIYENKLWLTSRDGVIKEHARLYKILKENKS